MSIKLYTLDNQFIEEKHNLTPKFTGIVVYYDGTKEWLAEGMLYRLDGPACEWADGSKSWWINNKRHRLDGPACEWANGKKYWYVDDKLVTEKQCRMLHSIMKLKGLI